METFVVRALRKIRKETSRRQKDLRDACDEVLGSILAKKDQDAPVDSDADKHFKPFKLACLSRHPRIMDTALDCIQKLIAYGYLRGLGPADGPRQATTPPGGLVREEAQTAAGRRMLMDEIVDVVCSCSDFNDDNVQLQVIKALLTAVTSSTCEVHESSLLRAVRAVYHIHLVSKNMVNKTTAKATLTQMLNIVFQKMEANDAQKRLSKTDGAQAAEVISPDASKNKSGGGSPYQLEEDNTRFEQENETSRQEEETGVVQGQADSVSAPDDKSAEQVRNGFSAGASMYASVASTLALKLSGPPHSFGESAAPLVHDPLRENEQPVQERTESTTDLEDLFPSILHKDAFLLFRSLCKISMKALPDDPTVPVDPIALVSKILSLELILSVLENSGPAFRSGDRFVYAIRQYLCMSLIKNCTSNNTHVVGLSLRIFALLIRHFKDHLKLEMELFISNIFLRILESANSTFDHKMLVLEVFYNLAQDRQTLVEIFLNYDCDWDSIDLFKRIVNALSKVAKGRAAADYQGNKRTSQEEFSLRMISLESLVNIVKSLVKASGGDNAESSNLASVAEAAEAIARAEAAVTRGKDEDEEEPPAQSMQQSTPMSAVESYDRKQKIREEIENGIVKFNMKPASGIQFLVQHGHLEATPAAVAQFLHEHSDELDKAQVGEYLGKEMTYQDGFCVQVLHEYVDQMDFSGLTIDEAIRVFCAEFRLPGEAQKIDRMIEKFAERYCINNPGVFPSADTAFILAFSVIMLNTDLHNDSVQANRKMTKEDFIKMNRGIAANNESLPDEFLSTIFDRIASREIVLKGEDGIKAKAARAKAGGLETALFGANSAAVEKQKREAFILERESMIRMTEAMFKRRRNPAGPRRNTKPSVTELDGRGNSMDSMDGQDGQAPAFWRVDTTAEAHVKPMFDVAWAPVLAVFSVMLETSNDPTVISLCLTGIRHAIRISATYGMETERHAYVTSLARFTTLDTVREMRPKNIECIKAMIAIALTEGENLGQSWGEVLQCISQLARLQMSAMGLQSDEKFFPTTGGSAAGGGRTPSTGGGLWTTTSSAPQSTGAASSVDTWSPASAGSRDGSATPGQGGGGDRRKSSGKPVISTFAGRKLNAQFPLFTLGGTSRKEAVKAMEDANAVHILEEIDTSAIDRIFSSSVTLSGPGIQDFVEQLCAVSLSELTRSATGYGQFRGHQGAPGEGTSHPRIFSLQKIVEVADFNMTVRPRIVWARIWSVLSRHFTTVGCHENHSIAMYAIDSLRQLSSKFLEKDELRDFHFQRLFLKPFEVIMANSPSSQIRELVLCCLMNLIQTRVHNIRSGWKTIFVVFNVAANDAESALVSLAFQSVEMVIRDHFASVVHVFVEVVNCLLSFAANAHADEVSIPAIKHLHTCVQQLAEGHVVPTLADGIPALEGKSDDIVTGMIQELQRSSSGGALASAQVIEQQLQRRKSLERKESDGQEMGGIVSPRASRISDTMEENSVEDGAAYTDLEIHLRAWWPVLTGLAGLVGDSRKDVSDLALETLFSSLKLYGSKFSARLWELVFKGVLFPVFDDVRHSDMNRTADMIDTFEKSLSNLLTLFSYHFSSLYFLLEDVLGLLNTCICQKVEELAIVGVRGFHAFVSGTGESFTVDTWSEICATIQNVVEWSIPSEVTEWAQALSQRMDKQASKADMGAERKMAGSQPPENGASQVSGAMMDAGRTIDTERGSVAAEEAEITNEAVNHDTPASSVDSRADEEVQVEGASEPISERLESEEAFATSGEAKGVSDRSSPETNADRAQRRSFTLDEFVNGRSGGGQSEASCQSRINSGNGASKDRRPPSLDPRLVVTKLAVMLEMQHMLGSVAARHLRRLTRQNCRTLCDLLSTTSHFTHDFNMDVPVRTLLFERGIRFPRTGDQVPDFLPQETYGVLQHLHVLFCLYSLTEADEECATSEGEVDPDGYVCWDRNSFAEEKLTTLLRDTLQGYLEMDHIVREADFHETTSAERHVAAPRKPLQTGSTLVGSGAEQGPTSIRSPVTLEADLVKRFEAFHPVAVAAVDGWRRMSDKKFSAHLGWLFPILIELVGCREMRVRKAVQSILRERIGSLLNLELVSSPRQKEMWPGLGNDIPI